MTPSASTRRPAWATTSPKDLGRVAQDRDPCGDLAQRLLGIGAATERLARQVELLDQPGRPDRDRGLVGDGLEQAGVGVAPGVCAGGLKTISAPNGPFSSVSGAAMTELDAVDAR